MQSTGSLIINFEHEGLEHAITVTQLDTGKKVRCYIAEISGTIGAAMVYCKKPSGLETYTDADIIDDHTVEFDITEQMNAEVGDVKSQLQLFGEDKSLTSYKFKIKVTENMIASSKVTSADDYPAFRNALEKFTGMTAEFRNELEGEKSERQAADEVEKSERQAADAAEKAERMQEIAVERARINNLVASNNPTEGNSELQDIRVGYDGTRYENAGEAVREQIGLLSEEMENKVGKIEVQSISNGVQQNRKGVYENKKNISENKESIFEIYEILKSITEFKKIPIIDENAQELSTDIKYLIGEFARCIKTDTSLTDEMLPANAKSVGDAIKESNRFLYDRFKQNRDISITDWGIPIFDLYGSMEGMSKEDKKEFIFSYRDSERNYTGTCTMKWQGSSSIFFPKKNFTIKFNDELEFSHEWGKHNKYCLKANYIDCSHSRNIVNAKLWGQITHNRESPEYVNLTDGTNMFIADSGDCIAYNDNPLTDLVNGGAIDGYPVIIVLNDEFYGLYTLNIPKDAWMLDMENRHGKCAIITSETNSEKSSIFHETALVDGSDYDIEYVSDDFTESDLINSFNNLIQSCIDCHTAESYEQLKNYIDVENAIDFLIFGLFISHHDYVKNLVFATYNGEKFFINAYDMDSTYGNLWYGTEYKTVDSTGISDYTKHRLFYLVIKYDSERIKSRFSELESSIMKEDNILFMFSNFIAKIPKVVLNEDFLTWTYVPSTEGNNISQILNYYRLRLPYVKEQINRL